MNSDKPKNMRIIKPGVNIEDNARLWRQGQSSGTVVIQHIITKGTIDERILKALEAKDRTQAALIDAVKVALEV